MNIKALRRKRNRVINSYLAGDGTTIEDVKEAVDAEKEAVFEARRLKEAQLDMFDTSHNFNAHQGNLLQKRLL